MSNNKFHVLWHVTKSHNVMSIKSRGLEIGRKASGYGATPSKEAVYLFHPKNTQPIHDFIMMHEEFAVFEVRIPVGSELVNYFVADEDATKYVEVAENDWEGSLEKFGTCAITKNIPAALVTLVFKTDFNRRYRKLSPSKIL